MLGTAAVIVAAISLAALELPPLLRKGWGREAAVYVALLGLGAYTGVLAMRQARIENPLFFLIAVYKPVADWVSAWFA